MVCFMFGNRQIILLHKQNESEICFFICRVQERLLFSSILFTFSPFRILLPRIDFSILYKLFQEFAYKMSALHRASQFYSCLPFVLVFVHCSLVFHLFPILILRLLPFQFFLSVFACFPFASRSSLAFRASQRTKMESTMPGDINCRSRCFVTPAERKNWTRWSEIGDQVF